MNEKDCLITQYNLLKGLFFDDKYETSDYLLCTSKVIDDHFWNLAYIKNSLNKELLREIENKLALLNRKPCIYIGTKNDNYINNIKVLLNNNYELCDRDTYMVLDNQKDIDIKIDLKIVSNEKEYNDFMKVISSAYNDTKENEDENVYSGSITECYYKAIKDTIGSNNHLHIIAYDNGIPVAGATLNIFNGIFGINNVGTRQGYWNKGYGTQVIGYIINLFNKLNGNTLILSTEFQSKNQLFYEKLGFKVLYVMEQYTKKE